MRCAERDKKPGGVFIDYLSDSFARKYLLCRVGFTKSVRDL